MWIARLVLPSVVGLFLLSGKASAADPEINSVLGFEGMAEYARASESPGDSSREELFTDLVYSRYFDRCSGTGDRRSMSRRFLSTPPGDVSALAGVITEIQESDALDRIRQAARVSTGELPIDKLTICIFAIPPDSEMAEFVIDTFNGVFGFVESPGVLWIQLLPTEGWLDEIYPAFAHEYYHAAAHPDNPMGTAKITLLDMLVNEGGADSFAAILYPDFVPSWTKAISLQQEIDLWPRVKQELGTKDLGKIQDFLYGDGNAIPFQAGYTIGFQIVQGYLAAHPDESPEVWSRVNPKVILDESGYRKRVSPGQ